MTIKIFGSHTAPYGDFPYHKGDEFESALKNNWEAITFFHFSSIDTAEVTLDSKQVAEMTVREVYSRLGKAIMAAMRETNWNIWHDCTLSED